MAYYNTCPECGALLDPGEKCDCYKLSEQLQRKYELLTTITKDGQIIFGGMDLCPK
jgi:hypothetical protein